jgi:hypothetical protein
MTITNGYATLDELKHINVLNISTTNSDDILETVIEGISRAIDNYCGRRFFAASETRFYTPEQSSYLAIDDVSTTASFTLLTDDGADGTYENTWVADTDFELLPYNAVLDGLPYTSIEIKPLGNFRFPIQRKSVKITASFGWAAVPKPVNRACVLQATRLFKRYITPLGQSAATAIGTINLTIPALDPDVTQLLRPYERLI